MDKTRIQQLRETLWRRPLSDTERQELEGWLALHPDQQADWELELALNRSLDGQPETEISSNFTARVMVEVEREAAPVVSSRSQSVGRWFWRLLPRMAVVLVLLGIGVWQFAQWKESKERELAAQQMQIMVEVTSVAGPDLLADFEAINRLGIVTPDTELLSMLE